MKIYINVIFNKKADEGKRSSLLKEQNITGIVVSRQFAVNQTLSSIIVDRHTGVQPHRAGIGMMG